VLSLPHLYRLGPGSYRSPRDKPGQTGTDATDPDVGACHSGGMTEDTVRTRRNFPAETWAVVRDAYLGGETAESIARRLNMSVNTIRKRASRCGWTHAAHARAIQRASEDGPAAPIDLARARDAAVAHAAALLTEGRALEASAILRAAEALGRVVGGDAAGLPSTPEPGPEPEPETPESAEAVEAARRQIREHIDQVAAERAGQLALDLLTDEGPPQAVYGAFAFRWRAMILGPAVALADYARGLQGGWASHYWDAEGRLIPQDPVPPAPDPGMVRQHLRLCRGAAGEDEGDGDWVWPPRGWAGRDGAPRDGRPEAEAEDARSGHGG